MDTTLPISTQPPVTVPPVVPPPPAPIAVSDQPLTLDPNQMPTSPAPLERVAVQVPTVVSAISPPQPAFQPVGGPHKEHAPGIQAPVSEYMRPSEQMPSLSPEVAEAGVEVTANSEQPQLDGSHKAAGIEPARAAIPVIIPQTTSIYLPYSPIEAKKVEKESSTGESRHWLAQLTAYIIRKFQTINA